MKYGLRSAVCGLAMTMAVTALSPAAFAQSKQESKQWNKEKAKIEKLLPKLPSSDSCLKIVKSRSSPNVRDSLLSRLDGVRVIFIGINHVRDFKREWAASLIPQLRGKININAVGFEELPLSYQDSLSVTTIPRRKLPITIEDGIRYVYPRTQVSDYVTLYLIQNSLNADAQLVAMHPDSAETPASSCSTDPDPYVLGWSASMLAPILARLKANPSSVALVPVGEQHVGLMAKIADSSGFKPLSIQVLGADEVPLPENEAHGQTRVFFQEANKYFACFAPLLKAQATEYGASELFIGNDARQMSSWADVIIFKADSKPKDKSWYLERTTLRFWQDLLPPGPNRSWVIKLSP